MRFKTLQLDETLTAFSAGGRSILTPGIPTDFAIADLFINVRGRFRVTAAGSANLPEAPMNVIERIRIFGNHKNIGNREILNLEGVDLFRYAQFYNLVQPRAEGGGLDFAIGEYDFDVMYPIAFWTQLTNAGGRKNTILDAPSFNHLQLDITWAGVTDFVTGGTTAFTDFGGTTGNPSVTLHRRVALLGPEQIDFNPALIKRTYESVGLSSNALTDGILTRNLPIGNTLRSVMLKAGTRSGASGAFATVSDALITRMKLKLSGEQIRDYDWNAFGRINEVQQLMSLGCPVGYRLMEFVEEGDLDDGLITVDFGARGIEPALAVTSTSVADGRVNVITTEILAAS